MTTTTDITQSELPLRDPAPGLVTLGPAYARLFEGLDGLLRDLADRLGAVPVIGPPLLPAGVLATLDYFRNFPHLGVIAGRLSPAAMDEAAAGADIAALAATSTLPTGFMLPSATCYGLLMSLAGADLAGAARMTAIGRCFRNEDHYDGLRRLWGFHMREVLYVGDAEGAVEHLAVSRTAIAGLAERLGVELTVVAANDPFYDRSGSRAKLTMLDPVKHEFVTTDGVAIASVNRHRNFFGERLGLRCGGETAYSSCTAFGIERWLHALILAHGSAGAALERVEHAAG
jgi:hypothetical protein